jgi:TonB family protein
MPPDTPDADHGAPGVTAFENWQPISFLGLPAWRAWMSSVVFHAVAVTAMATITFPPVTHVRPEDSKAFPTRLKIGEKLYFVSRILPQPPAEQRPSSLVAPKAPTPQPPKVEITPPEPVARAQAPRVFAPPQVRRNLVSESTVIQPLSPPELVFPQTQPLPTFEIQAPRPMRLSKPFVVPGNPTPRPVEDAKPLPPPPQLEVARAAPVTFAPRSTLVLPPGPPPVVDVRPPDVDSRVEPTARLGDPVSILSLSDVSVPPAPEIVVPAGNVLGRTGEGIVAVAGTEGAGADRGAPRPSAEGAFPDSARPPATASGAAPSAPAPPPLKPNQMRRPNDGQFDAVVVQNTPTDQFPESRGLLSGRPIYSVYISMGTRKDWTLYFSVPGTASQQQSGTRVVTLNSVTPVLAPYPTLLEKPVVNIPAFFKYVLVHGTVNESGRFQNLRVVRSTRPDADKTLLAALANWEFRPASREGAKIAVEVLLHIPVDGL